MNTLLQSIKSFSLTPKQVNNLVLFAGFLLLITMADYAFAQAMPWEGPLCRVMNSMNSTVARSVAIVAIVVAGLTLALGETGGIFKLLLQLLFGLSVALLATQWLGFIDPASGSFSC